MMKLLETMASGNLGRRLQWITTGREEVMKLRVGLEAHKSTLDLALDMSNM
jgi:hypothetical protein